MAINIIGITTDARSVSAQYGNLTEAVHAAARWLTDPMHTTRGTTPFVRFFLAAQGQGPRWELVPAAVAALAEGLRPVTFNQVETAKVTSVRYRDEKGLMSHRPARKAQ